MKMWKVVVLGLMLASSAAYCQDERKWYFGLAQADNEVRIDDSPNYEEWGVTGKLGYDFSSLLGFEVHYGSSAKSNQTIGLTSVDLEVNQLMGAFVRANLPIGRKTKVYVLGGYSSARIGMETPAIKESMDLNGASYGFGLELYGTKNAALMVEWVNYVVEGKLENDDIGIDRDAHLNQLNVGFTYHFY